MPRRKKELPAFEKLPVVDIDSKGRGVIKHNEHVAFVPQACPGDVISAQAFRKKKGIYEAKLTELHSASERRVDPFCQHFEDCGGCKLQHISYEYQTELKHKMVKDAIERIGKVPYGKFEPILACEQTRYYRNKLEYSFSNKRWFTQKEIETDKTLKETNGLGFHVPGRYDKILHIDKCHFQADPSNAIRNRIYDFGIANNIPFYDVRKHTGVLRSLLMRSNEKNEFMIMLMIAGEDASPAKAILDHIHENFGELKSSYFVVNNKVNDSIYDLEPIFYKGKEGIDISVGPLKFKTTPKSFMQTNTQQTESLYNLVKEYAELKSSDVVYDLFCGVGTIGMYLADQCKKVIGIETVPEAIEMAKANQKYNDIENAHFIVGSAEKTLTESFKEKYPAADVVITDPPRMGMHGDVVKYLLQMRAPRIVYVSCNPATQARDIALLSEAYDLEKIRPVDMFPHTPHVESVALLTLKNS